MSTKKKKVYLVKPSQRQKDSYTNLVEKGGSIGGAMVEAGYSPITAKNPQKLTDSKGFQLLLAKAGATDAEVAKILKDKLYAKKVVGYINSKIKGDIERVGDEFLEVDDHYVQLKAVELWLKIKGYLVEHKVHSGKVEVDFRETLADFLDRLEDRAERAEKAKEIPVVGEVESEKED